MRLVERVHELLSEKLSVGDLTVDATAGNGWDTAFLASKVGSSGTVHAFDLQEEALEATRKLLLERGMAERVELHHCGHEQMAERLSAEFHGKVAAITFNLGYLPGGNKAMTTKTDTTLAALRVGLTLLRPRGLLAVVAYRGHLGGVEECQTVRRELKTVDVELTMEGDLSPDATSPLLLVARKG